MEQIKSGLAQLFFGLSMLVSNVDLGMSFGWKAGISVYFIICGLMFLVPQLYSFKKPTKVN